MAEIDWDALRDRIAREQYKSSSTMSLIWLLRSELLYRASQVLYETAKKANERSIQALLQEIEEDRKNKDPNKPTTRSRPLTLEERRLGVDESLFLPSFYFLARAMEVLLKAILIDRQEDYFLKTGKHTLDTKKLKHDLNFYIKECGIALDETGQEHVNLLIQVNTWGTYPIPVDEATWLRRAQESHQSESRLNLNTYPKVALLYDKILDTFNERRAKINKSTWINIFKT
jgi:hypothetical protein